MNNSLWLFKKKLYRSFRIHFPFNLILKRENLKIELLIRSVSLENFNVIDLGCGTGNALQFLKNTKRTIGVDLTYSMLATTKEYYPDILLIQANAMKLPVREKNFEFATAIGLSEYIKNLRALFEEISKILIDDGFFLMTFSPPGLFSKLRLFLGHRIYPLTLKRIERIAEDFHFNIIKTERTMMQYQVLLKKRSP